VSVLTPNDIRPDALYTTAEAAEIVGYTRRHFLKIRHRIQPASKTKSLLWRGTDLFHLLGVDQPQLIPVSVVKQRAASAVEKIKALRKEFGQRKSA
jgi:hypothetical protein